MANPVIKVKQEWNGLHFVLPHKVVILPTNDKGECTVRELSRALNTVLAEARCDG